MTDSQQDPLRVRCLLCCKTIQCNRANTAPLISHLRDAHPEVTIQSSDEINSIKSASYPELSKSRSHAKNPSQEGSNLARPPSSRTQTEKKNSSGKKDMKPLEAEILERIKELGHQPKGIIVNRGDIPGFGTGNRDSNSIELDKHPDKNNDETKILYKREYKYKKPFKGKRPGKRKLYKTSIEKWRPGRSTIVCPECGANKRPLIKSHVDKISHSAIGAAFILTCWPFCFLPCLFPPQTKEYLHCSVCNHFLGIYDRKTEVVSPNENSLKRHGAGGTTSSSEAVQTELTQSLIKCMCATKSRENFPCHEFRENVKNSTVINQVENSPW